MKHLFLEKEILGLRLATVHNLVFYMDLMESIRKAVETNRLNYFAAEFSSNMEETDD